MTVSAIHRTQAEQALRTDEAHVWLQCFRMCKRCHPLSETLTEYEFSDGSKVILDASYPFPKPIKSMAALRIA